MATMLPAVRLPGYAPRSVRSGPTAVYEGFLRPWAYKLRTTGILQKALVSSIIFYVTRVAVMAPCQVRSPGKECCEDERRDR
jgi:hypothetical protein